MEKYFNIHWVFVGKQIKLFCWQLTIAGAWSLCVTAYLYAIIEHVVITKTIWVDVRYKQLDADYKIKKEG